MADECPPLDLGGRTVASPCLAAFGYYCSPWDYWETRRLLQNERNALVDRLTYFYGMVKAGKAKWTPATSAAYELANGPSYDLLMEYGDSNWNILRDGIAAETPARLFVEMTQRVHGALCDVDSELAHRGEIVPQTPPPVKPPERIEDRILNFIIAGAQGTAIVGGLLVAGVFAYRYVTSSSKG